MKKATKTAALLATACALGLTAVPVNAFAAKAKSATEYSAEEKEAIKSVFDPAYYAEENEDVVAELGASEEALFTHYLEFGIDEDRPPSDKFNINAYASCYPDLESAFGSDAVSYIVHYNKYGRAEGRTLTTVAAAKKAGCAVHSVTAFEVGSTEVSEATKQAEKIQRVATAIKAILSTPAADTIVGTITFTYDGKEYTYPSTTTWEQAFRNILPADGFNEIYVCIVKDSNNNTFNLTDTIQPGEYDLEPSN